MTNAPVSPLQPHDDTAEISHHFHDEAGAHSASDSPSPDSPSPLRHHSGDLFVEAHVQAAAYRSIEAVLFASPEPVSEVDLASVLPHGVSLSETLHHLQRDYAGRGVNLVKAGECWLFRTAPDLAHVLTHVREEPKKLSRVALETLAIVAYHQPVTRAEIEDIRGVSTMRGTLDTLIETGWVRLRGRRKSPGRPVTYGTTPAFLIHFGLESLDHLPGLDELKGAGFIEGRIARGFKIPLPNDSSELSEDEEPLEIPDTPLFFSKEL
jgi:segregation and condensation protein B